MAAMKCASGRTWFPLKRSRRAGVRGSLECSAGSGRAPGTPDHDDLLQWLGIERGTDFDPARFDPADADRRLDTVVLAASRTD
jgi:hypothetical protein